MAKIGWPKLDGQNWMAKIGLPKMDGQNWMAKLDCQKYMAKFMWLNWHGYLNTEIKNIASETFN